MIFKKEFEFHLEDFLLPQVNVDEWIETYDIGHSLSECSKCGFMRKPMIPFAGKEVRGFFYESCSCDTSPALKFIPINQKERQAMKDLALLLFGNLPSADNP